MEENKVIQIPEWILKSVKDALQMNYNAMIAGGDTSCTRRQTAKAINYVNLYLTKDSKFMTIEGSSNLKLNSNNYIAFTILLLLILLNIVMLLSINNHNNNKFFEYINDDILI
jgi:hypothetical protein